MRVARHVLALLLAIWAGTAAAQVTTPEALYHGVLTVNPARGTLDLVTGNALLKAGHWRADLNPETNGMFPDREPILFAIGEEIFRLPDDMMRSSRKGKMFSYRAKPAPERGIGSLRLQRRRNGSWSITFDLRGVELSALFVDNPVCKPLALIVGDDDFFNGVLLSRAPPASTHLRIPSDCDATGGWPWIR